MATSGAPVRSPSSSSKAMPPRLVAAMIMNAAKKGAAGCGTHESGEIFLKLFMRRISAVAGTGE